MSTENKVENLDVRVEQQSAGWVVIANLDGTEKQMGAAHASREEADVYAKHMFSGADRWTGAAEKVDPDPMYPGDGK
jgi:hypothetical protein